MSIIKFKELKKGVHYSIPCKREDGTEDSITIIVRYDEESKTDVIYLNNEFMGAYLEKVRDDAYWLKITNKIKK